MDPIKDERDYVGLGRQGFIKDVLTQGDAPYYDLDINVPAIVVTKRGSVPQVRTESTRVFVDIFPIASYPLIPIEDTRMRRFNVLDRVQVKARADLAEEEDAVIFGTPDGSRVSEYSVATNSTLTPEANTVNTSTEGVTRDLVVKTMAEILQHDLIPEAIICHPRQYVDFFTWGRDEFDPETQREVLLSGRVGKLWNLEIMMSKQCPSGTMYMRTSGEYFGVLPVLIDLDVQDAPDWKGLAYGFVFYEFIGAAIVNAYGAARSTVTYTADL